MSEVQTNEIVQNQNSFSFKTTPVSKVILLSFLTAGIYDLILIFNYWKTVRDNMGLKVSPFWRSVFAVLTNYKLFPIFKEYFEKYNINFSNVSLLASGYLLCTWLDNKITFRTLALEEVNYSLEITILILELITALILGFVQNKINKINEQNFPDAEQNPWKVSNIIWAIIFALITIGTFLG
ncbi:MAG: hypothetical protein NC408_00655 [Candidatus Gastranaerophilales bacterium]|nr:hypothetical protein [Candidatus Gastranaerophilales bacterium]MCM1073705.1 hypothetical protein [Bacteroides sp.]